MQGGKKCFTVLVFVRSGPTASETEVRPSVLGRIEMRGSVSDLSVLGPGRDTESKPLCRQYAVVCGTVDTNRCTLKHVARLNVLQANQTIDL